ncbi:hypothetical protein ElyMa_006419000 [Elysia marginata]|uniref:Uncharacterized protein n=1 Tax=Elysia marginata TaxID=1093978 RepID=A0AAV4HUZ7_9GAST|nr:hypothetical protein ElyMa_006419000 [Elysia marginata]
MVAKLGPIPRRFKEDTDVRNVVLQETSQGPMDRKEKQQQKSYTWPISAKDCCNNKAETWVYLTHHERQLRTFATTILRWKNRREDRTGKAKRELERPCKGMVRIEKLWIYKMESREQRRMERPGW